MRTRVVLKVLLAVITRLLLFAEHGVKAKKAASSSSSSWWTYKYPNTLMEWNNLPEKSTRLECRTITVVLDEREQEYDDNDENDNGDVSLDSYDMVIAGYTNVSSSNATISGTSGGSTEMLLLDRLDRKYYKGILSRLKDEMVNSSVADTSSLTLQYDDSSSQDDGNENDESKTNHHYRRRLLWMNVGNTSSASDARKVGTALAALVTKGQQRKHNVTSMSLLLPLQQQLHDADNNSNNNNNYLTELATAFWVGLYQDRRYKGSSSQKDSTDEQQSLQVDLIIIDGDKDNDDNDRCQQEEEYDKALWKARSLAQAVYLSKDIVQAPHNVLNSLSLADTAQRLARLYKSCLSCQILDAEECERLGMGAFLGVARGSETPARFIHLTYTPPSDGHKKRNSVCRIHKKLGVIGKGLLFDTGGYNIKTQMMELMKFDCGGAAAVLGAARAVAELEPQGVQVHFLVAACENMINERAIVPSDILTASNGKTIEVLNTDAEGRLTLADALVYADQTLGCDEIVELSTLTGACMVALGSSIAGLWTKSDELALQLLKVSETTGEKIWRMPLNEEDYGEQLKSKIADLKNLGGRYGGAISAALFLQHFVKDDKPFAHIDMAGTVWDMKASQATGWGAKLVAEWVCSKGNLFDDS